MNLLNRFNALPPDDKETFGRLVVAYAMTLDQIRGAAPHLFHGMPLSESLKKFIDTLEPVEANDK